MSILIKNMNMPDKCWDCELFDELAIHFTGITAPNTDIGWCRGCEKEILDMDYKECKPIWCPLVEVSTPYGDLIDKRIVLYEIYEYMYNRNYAVGHLYDVISEAVPVTIESEE